MAEMDLKTATSTMEALVRINVSTSVSVCCRWMYESNWCSPFSTPERTAPKGSIFKESDMDVTSPHLTTVLYYCSRPSYTLIFCTQAVEQENENYLQAIKYQLQSILAVGKKNQHFLLGVHGGPKTSRHLLHSSFSELERQIQAIYLIIKMTKTVWAPT